VDESWSSGPAQLGFGDGDEATALSQTNPQGGTNLTFYFRHVFEVTDLASITNVMVRLRRDDGAVVYLNGTEIFRSNLPPGPITPATLALMATPDDGAGYFANSVNRALLSPGPNVLAVEVHQSAVTSSDISFDLELLSNVEFTPPNVAIVNPTDGALVGAADLTVDVAVSDVDGTIALVELFQNGSLVAMASSSPFSLTWSNVASGNYLLTAAATDSSGLTSTSAPVSVRIPPRLIASGSTWRYLDTGMDPGPAWTTAGFNDTSWLVGLAELGFGDGDEATVISRTNNVGGTNITFYFRQAFNVSDRSSISNLIVRVRRDDGCAAYLNGIEIFRDNLPAGAVTATTLATTAIDDPRFHSARVNPSLLLAGPNIVAIEVHQAAITSSDIGMDLELLPNIPPSPPTLAITSPTNNTRLLEPAALTVTTVTSDLDDRIASVGFLLNGASAGTDTTDPFSLSLSNLSVGIYTLSAVATDEFGNRTTAAPVQFRVVPLPVFSTLIPTGSVWKYSDSGTDLGTAWRERTYNDAAWPAGPGKLGYADNPVTAIDIGPVGNRHPTAYFRHRFQASDVINITNFSFRVLRDDGCVAYLNGVELFRMNMPAGAINFSKTALTSVGGTNENYYFPLTMDPPWATLVEGENVLAVEVHQSDLTTTDAGFDLGMTAMKPAPGATTRMTITHPDASIRINWAGPGFFLQDAPTPGGPFTDINPPVTAGPYVVPTPSGNRFFRLRPGP
jgi:hypothetical protein